MHALGLQPDTAGVYFGQLLGMADRLTFTLASHGYKAYKWAAPRALPDALLANVMA